MLFLGGISCSLLGLHHGIFDLSGLDLVLFLELLGGQIFAILALASASALALLALASTLLLQLLLTSLLVSKLKLSPLLSLLHSPSLGFGGLSSASGLEFLELLLALNLSLALSLDDGFLILNPLSLLLAELLDASILVPSLLLESLLLLLTFLGLNLTSALSLLLLSLLDCHLSSALGGGLSTLSLFLSLALDIEDTSPLEHDMAVPLGMNSALHGILLSLSVMSDVSHVVSMMTRVVSLVNSVPVSTSSHLLFFVVSMLVSAMSLDISSLSAGSSSFHEALVMSLA